jgi:hypothetical protein
MSTTWRRHVGSKTLQGQDHTYNLNDTDSFPECNFVVHWRIFLITWHKCLPHPDNLSRLRPKSLPKRSRSHFEVEGSHLCQNCSFIMHGRILKFLRTEKSNTSWWCVSFKTHHWQSDAILSSFQHFFHNCRLGLLQTVICQVFTVDQKYFTTFEPEKVYF